MQILIADDDAPSRRLLEVTLQHFGYEVIVTADGLEAWERLRAPDAPRVAVLDWLMPGVTGPELCQRIRATPELASLYVILLTGKRDREDIVAGLEAGADDYLTKPFDQSELRARVRVGERVVGLERALASRVDELEQALAQVKTLEGMIPICAWCRKVRTEEELWQRIEEYVVDRSQAKFSHGICPECAQSR